MIDAVIHRLTIYTIRIPLRTMVSHAAAERKFALPIIVEAELINGIVGYGETHPRAYVTGETTESVLADLQRILAPAAMSFHARSFPECLECIESLPHRHDDGRIIAAARATIELALLDASMKAFRRDVDAIVQWMGLGGFGSPGSSMIRYSGVLASDDDRGTLRKLRLMYWAGLRHFKLKVGFDGDLVRLARVATYLKRARKLGRATLRVDANGAWTPEQATEWMASASSFGIAGVEQPVARGSEDALDQLGRLDPAGPAVILDESLIDMEDAQRLAALGMPKVFSIRISKCAGLLPSLRIAAFARRHGIPIQLGCMVGESSILSAAGIRFLQATPGVKWAEGCFGKLLIERDVVDKSLRFGLGGKCPRVSAEGLGANVSPEKLSALCERDPIVIHL